MSSPGPVTVAVDHVLWIPDFDASACDERPDCELDAKIRKYEELIWSVTEGDISYLSKITSRSLYDRRPLLVIEVVQSDCVVICE